MKTLTDEECDAFLDCAAHTLSPMNTMIRAVYAAGQESVNQWQAIETAPCDTYIDVYHTREGRITDRWWRQDFLSYFSGTEEQIEKEKAMYTHYMLIPKTPEWLK
jgi:hypothetical protein